VSGALPLSDAIYNESPGRSRHLSPSVTTSLDAVDYFVWAIFVVEYVAPQQESVVDLTATPVEEMQPG
jgi:hypothetical protein